MICSAFVIQQIFDRLYNTTSIMIELPALENKCQIKSYFICIGRVYSLLIIPKEFYDIRNIMTAAITILNALEVGVFELRRKEMRQCQLDLVHSGMTWEK